MHDADLALNPVGFVESWLLKCCIRVYECRVAAVKIDTINSVTSASQVDATVSWLCAAFITASWLLHNSVVTDIATSFFTSTFESECHHCWVEASPLLRHSLVTDEAYMKALKRLWLTTPKAIFANKKKCGIFSSMRFLLHKKPDIFQFTLQYRCWMKEERALETTRI